VTDTAHRSPLFVASAAAVIAAMVATPLAAVGSDTRVVLSTVIVCGYFVISVIVAYRTWGRWRAVGAAATVVALTLTIEFIGSTTGFPFGDYDYTTLLQPQLGGVPVIVPLAWFGMGLAAREVAASLVGANQRVGRVLLGAAALTAWDAFLDPQMVTEGYWVWASDGAYRGSPLTNYAGWMASSVAVMVVLEWRLPPRCVQRASVAMYAFVAVMETIAFAFFFDDLVVALVGGVAMVPLSVLALSKAFGGRRV
jgi:putative membrane protein